MEGNLGDLPNLDRHWINGQHTTYAVFDRLVDRDASLQPHPVVAESWEVNPDFSQVTFHLRSGLAWHTGRPFSSEDVAWNYYSQDRRWHQGQLSSRRLPQSTHRTVAYPGR